MKVVFDTNILVSALVFPGGRAEVALRLATAVKPRRKLKVLADEPDNRIFECAVTGRAEAIISGDKALLQLKAYGGVRLLSLREYLG